MSALDELVRQLTALQQAIKTGHHEALVASEQWLECKEFHALLTETKAEVAIKKAETFVPPAIRVGLESKVASLLEGWTMGKLLTMGSIADIYELIPPTDSKEAPRILRVALMPDEQAAYNDVYEQATRLGVTAPLLAHGIFEYTMCAQEFARAQVRKQYVEKQQICYMVFRRVNGSTFDDVKLTREHLIDIITLHQRLWQGSGYFMYDLHCGNVMYDGARLYLIDLADAIVLEAKEQYPQELYHRVECLIYDYFAHSTIAKGFTPLERLLDEHGLFETAQATLERLFPTNVLVTKNLQTLRHAIQRLETKQVPPHVAAELAPYVLGTELLREHGLTDYTAYDTSPTRHEVTVRIVTVTARGSYAASLLRVADLGYSVPIHKTGVFAIDNIQFEYVVMQATPQRLIDVDTFDTPKVERALTCYLGLLKGHGIDMVETSARYFAYLDGDVKIVADTWFEQLDQKCADTLTKRAILGITRFFTSLVCSPRWQLQTKAARYENWVSLLVICVYMLRRYFPTATWEDLNVDWRQEGDPWSLKQQVAKQLQLLPIPVT